MGISAYLISEVRIYREGISHFLEADPRIELLGASSDLKDAGKRLAQIQPEPEVILLEVSPDARADVLTLRRVTGTAKILALGISGDSGDVLRCAEAGVAGFVCKDQSMSELIEAILRAGRDELLCDAATSGLLLRQVAKLSARSQSTDVPLTLREMQVLELINEGLGNKAIATRLSIQVATTKNHVHNILEKLGLQNRAQAAAYLRRSGLMRQDGAFPARKHPLQRR